MRVCMLTWKDESMCTVVLVGDVANRFENWRSALRKWLYLFGICAPVYVLSHMADRPLYSCLRSAAVKGSCGRPGTYKGGEGR